MLRLLEPGEIPFAQQGEPADGVFSVGHHLVKGYGPRGFPMHGFQPDQLVAAAPAEGKAAKATRTYIENDCVHVGAVCGYR